MLVSLSIEPAQSHRAIPRPGYLYSLSKATSTAPSEQSQAAVALDPKMADARNNLGFYLQQKMRYREAAAQFEEVLKRAPENQQARNNLGAVLFKISGHD